MHERPQRGLLTRPTVEEVLSYREHVDEYMQGSAARAPKDMLPDHDTRAQS